jgi:hypothetical protein
MIQLLFRFAIGGIMITLFAAPRKARMISVTPSVGSYMCHSTTAPLTFDPHLTRQC